MKVNFKMKNIKPYLIELIIVTVGVLLALYLSNLKESNQAIKYHKASIETIEKEVKANYSELNAVIEKQKKFHDTLVKYGKKPILIGKIFEKTGGLQFAELNNSGLDIYKKNQINSINFDIMSDISSMKNKSKIIDNKMNRLMDFAYLNMFDNSMESKMVFSIYIQDVLDSEKKLMKLYKDYIDKNIETENNKK